jgi:RimJ/RimL family protein N-acetyltransferase
MSSKPFLTTARFELWRPDAGDLDSLCALLDDEETRRFLGPSGPEASSQFDRLLRTAGGWALFGYGSFYVRRPGRREIIASCGMFPALRGFGKGMDGPEAGWIVRRDHWRQGVASEVMETALEWFDAAHGPRRISCMIEDGNTASEMLAARLGFVAYDSHVLEDPDPVNLTLYERLPV